MDDGNLRRLRDTSDDLMASLEELKDLEARKREEQISTPRFHRLAEDVEDQARRVFQLAALETDTGDTTGEPTGVTTEDIPEADEPSRGGDGVPSSDRAEAG